MLVCVTVEREQNGEKTVIVSELMDGDVFDLAVSLSAEAPVLLGLQFIIHALDTLVFLFDSKIVHNDIKLENFLFKKRGSELSFKLIDFQYSVPFENAKFTPSEGTLGYQAPEIFLPDEQKKGLLPQNVDIFSTGITLADFLGNALRQEINSQTA